MKKLPIRRFEPQPGQWTSWMNKNNKPIIKKPSVNHHLVDAEPVMESLDNIRNSLDGAAGVYVIICDKANRAYVGQSNNIRNRLIQHRSNIFSEKDKKRHYDRMMADAQEYGWGSFHFRIHEISKSHEKNTLLEMESKAMVQYQNNGYILYNCQITTSDEVVFCPIIHQKTIKEIIKALQYNPHIAEKILSFIQATPDAGTKI